jgi:hypothetical protein
VEHNSKRLRPQSASGTIEVEGGKEDDEDEEEKKEKRRRRTSKRRKRNLVVHKVNTGLESVNEKLILIPSTTQFWKPLCI